MAKVSAGITISIDGYITGPKLGGGKRLFEGFSESLDLQQLGVGQSQHATFIDYRVNPSRPR
jgi:hypothetical protein